ncbi:uncharacterized protein LOC144166954 isoform X2 [Haemaphysalis longicornis]
MEEKLHLAWQRGNPTPNGSVKATSSVQAEEELALKVGESPFARPLNPLLVLAMAAEAVAKMDAASRDHPYSVANPSPVAMSQQEHPHGVDATSQTCNDGLPQRPSSV